MIEITQELKQLSKLLNKVKFKDLNGIIKQNIRDQFYVIGKDLVKQSRDFMKEPKHGRLYRIGVGGKGKKLARLRNHIASAPDEAPAIITGALRASVDFLIEGSDELHFGVNLEHITPDSGAEQWHHQVANYAKYLEDGTSKMAPRPFLKPAMLKQGIKIFTRIEKSTQNVLNDCMKP